MNERGQGLDDDLVVPRRLVLTGLLLGGVAGLGMLGAGHAEARLGPTRSGAARTAVDPDSVSWVSTRRPVVALTFDDGPDPATTPAVLDLLARHDARATFFVVGSQVAAHPDLARRIVDEGHALANHTYDHAPLEQLRRDDVRAQLERCRALIDRYDHGPRYVRPPRGYTSPLVAQVCREAGEREVFWSCCLENTPGVDLDRGRTLAQGMRGGAVALAHDGGVTTGRWAQTYDRSGTVRSLAGLLPALTEQGLRSVTLADLLGDA